MTTCPICNNSARIQSLSVDNQLIHLILCKSCGSFRITDHTAHYLNNDLKSKNKKILLSHAIRKIQKNSNGNYPFLSHEQVLNILDNPFPKPIEQINNYITWLAESTLGFGEVVEIHETDLQIVIGASTVKGVHAVTDHLLQKGFIESFGTITRFDIVPPLILILKMEGWEYYENLKRGGSLSRKAFIAMKFGNNVLDDMLKNCFRPATKAAGFELFRLDDMPKAGLIDDRLRVEIRTSRFLIADLTHENAGAYWEAGFAEGLGKPVIYTCEKKVFDEKKTHFDTNHHTTVLWDKDDLEKTSRDLRNTIRATLPEEAKLTDDNQTK